MQKTPLPPNIGRPATNALQARGINNLEDLKGVSKKSVEEMHGIGPKAIAVLKQALRDAT